MENIVPTESREKYTLYEVMCTKCTHKWLRHTKNRISRIKCPNCSSVGTARATGQKYVLLKKGSTEDE